MDITLRLLDADSIDELQHGVWATLLWIEPGQDGTYTLHAAGVGGSASGEAFFRVALDRSFEANPRDRELLPPVYHQGPNEEVAGLMERYRQLLGWHSSCEDRDG